MFSNLNKKTEFKFLFVVYFLLCVVILPYSHCHADESQHSADKSIYSINCIKLHSSTYSCCDFHSEKHDNRHDHHTHFLSEDIGIKIRSNEIQKSKSLNYASIIKNKFALYFKSSFVIINQNNITKFFDGFHVLSSGLSPPII